MAALDRRNLVKLAVAAPLAMPAIVRAQGTPLRIGVLTDMSSWGRDNGGPGSVYAVNQAVRELGGSVAGRKVEVLVGDHKMTPDLGVQIARRWFDDGVEAVADCPHSAIALGVSALAMEKNRLALFSGPGSSDITNSRCNARNRTRFAGLRNAACCQLTTGQPRRIPTSCPSKVARVSEVHRCVGAHSRSVASSQCNAAT